MRSIMSLRAVLVFSLALAILGLAAGTARAALTWDTLPGTVGPGNSTITGGNGTWDTTTGNWTTDGGANNVAWDNTANANDTAIFGGTVGTVTLGGTINLGGLTFTTATGGYVINGGTLNFASGGTINQQYNNINQTIKSPITGSPTVNVKDSPAGDGYEGLIFAPDSGTQTLGVINLPDNTGTTDKAGVHLSGTTTGNSVSKVQYGGGDKYGTLYKDGTGTWTVGDVNVGTVRVNAGNLVANGKITTQYQGLNLNGGVLHYNNAGAVQSGGFSFNGGSLDNTSGAAIPTSTYNPAQTWATNLTFLGSNGANSDLYLGTGAVTLTGNRTVTIQNAATTLTVGGVVTDGTSFYGLTKDGPGTLVLNGTNTYNGATTVSAGTLSLGAASLDDSAPLYMTSTATLNLPHGAADTVFVLLVDGAIQPAGTYNSSTSTWLTGSGSIIAGNGLAPAGTWYWDGPNVGGDGDGGCAGGTGTWSTSNVNWDQGFTTRKVWNDTSADKAIFRTAAGTVNLDSDVTLGEMLIDGVDNYVIGADTETHSLNFGGTKAIKVDQVTATIKAGITGSPSLLIYCNSNDPMYLTPKGASMTLGDVTVGGVPNNPVLYLGGTANGNSINRVINGNTWSSIYKLGAGTWTLGDVTIGGIFLQAGTLVLNGTFNSTYSAWKLNFTGGTLAGTGTIKVPVTVSNNATLAPGNLTVGTLNVTGNTTMSAGSKYEWEFGGTDGDLVAITDNLTLTNLWKLKLVDLGGDDPLASEKYDLFTFTGTYNGSAVTTPIELFKDTNYTLDTILPDWDLSGIKVFVDAGETTGFRVYVTGIGISSVPGDTNDDDVVDAVDYIALKTNFGMTEGATLAQGNFDANIDGNVDWDDLQLLMANFGTRSVGGAPATPEPATLGLLAIGALAILRRRRRTA